MSELISLVLIGIIGMMLGIRAGIDLKASATTSLF